MSSKESLPDRYFTPQPPKKPQLNHAEAYQPTPRPDSVYVNENLRVSKNESCCFSCLLACFLCLAVKGDAGKNAPK